MEEGWVHRNSRARDEHFYFLKLQREKNDKKIWVNVIEKKKWRNEAHGELNKLHHQISNERSLNRSSGAHHYSSNCCASPAELHSSTLMVIDGALSVKAKCLSSATGHPAASKARHWVKTPRVQPSLPSEESKCHRTGPLRYCKFSMLCFLMCEYPESQPSDRGEKEKDPNKSFCTRHRSLSCTWRCRLAVCSAEWGMVLYLEGLKEAAASSSAPVLQLIFVSTQAHHGLTVDVQLLVQRF